MINDECRWQHKDSVKWMGLICDETQLMRPDVHYIREKLKGDSGVEVWLKW